MGQKNLTMKLLAVFGLTKASVWIHPEVRAANRALGIPIEVYDFDCVYNCTVELIREEVRCMKFEEGSPEYDQCLMDSRENYQQCMTIDGCLQADGTCAKRCLP